MCGQIWLLFNQDLNIFICDTPNCLAVLAVVLEYREPLNCWSSLSIISTIRSFTSAVKLFKRPRTRAQVWSAIAVHWYDMYDRENSHSAMVWMETHGVKHHYHHHQTNQQSSHHSSQSFSLGSNQNGHQTASKINLPFPLLLSHIDPGKNFNAPFSRTKTFSSTNNGTGNVSQSVSTQQHGHNSNTFLGLGAGKHGRQVESSHTNGGVKATPKPKSAATPNLITSSGRQQATFGHSTNGLSQAKSSHLTGEATVTSATLASSSLPFKKNLLARETLSNNGTCNRSKASPNKENKTATLSNASTTSLAPSPLKRPSIRSPSGPRSCSSNTSKFQTSSANHSQPNQFTDSAKTGGSLNGGGDTVSSPELEKSVNIADHLHRAHTQSTQPKTKEFKFFKEKAKDKLHKNLSVDDCDNETYSGLCKHALANSSKFKPSSPNNSGALRKEPKSRKTKRGLSGKSKATSNNNSASDFLLNGSQLHGLQSGVVSSLSYLSDSPAVAPSSFASLVPLDSPLVEPVEVGYSKKIIDGFTFYCFAEEKSIEVSCICSGCLILLPHYQPPFAMLCSFTTTYMVALFVGALCLATGSIGQSCTGSPLDTSLSVLVLCCFYFCCSLVVFVCPGRVLWQLNNKLGKLGDS